jgi:hypothetical protein
MGLVLCAPRQGIDLDECDITIDSGTINSISDLGGAPNEVRVTTAADHGLRDTDSVVMSGMSVAAYDGQYPITNIDATTTYDIEHAWDLTATGNFARWNLAECTGTGLGQAAWVTDGATETDCETGTGSFSHVCVSDGDGTYTALSLAEPGAVRSGADPDSSCAVGEIYLDTDQTNDTDCTTFNDNSLCLCTVANTWTALENEPGGVLFHGDVGTAAATTRVDGQFKLAEVTWTETADPFTMFAPANNNDEVCYSGPNLTNVSIRIAFSLEPSVQCESTTAVGVAATGLGDGDEVGEQWVRDHSAATTTGMGAVEIVADLDTNDCIGILFQMDAAGTMTYRSGTLTISR